jgi:hypothetical protein
VAASKEEYLVIGLPARFAVLETPQEVGGDAFPRLGLGGCGADDLPGPLRPAGKRLKMGKGKPSFSPDIPAALGPLPQSPYPPAIPHEDKGIQKINLTGYLHVFLTTSCTQP